MEPDVISFGSLKFYRLSSGTVVPIYDGEPLDWFSIETTDPEDQNVDEDEDEDDDNA